MESQPHIDETAKAILLGLKRSGKTRTFSQILDEAKIRYSKEHIVDIANLLEALNLIKSVSYQLPIAIRAELSQEGVALVRSFSPPEDSPIKPRTDGMSDKNRSVFL